MAGSLSCLFLMEKRHCSSKDRCLIRAARGTWNFIWKQATLVQGCTSEAHLNMDVNLCRLPDEMKSISKFPVPLADIRWHLSSTDSTNILSKQPKRQFIIKKNRPIRTVDISHKRKSDVLWLLQNSLILNVISTSQSANSASESHPHQEPQTGSTLHCPGSHDAYRFR